MSVGDVGEVRQPGCDTRSDGRAVGLVSLGNTGCVSVRRCWGWADEVLTEADFDNACAAVGVSDAHVE